MLLIRGKAVNMNELAFPFSCSLTFSFIDRGTVKANAAKRNNGKEGKK